MSDTVKLMIELPKEVYEESIVVHSILSGTIIGGIVYLIYKKTPSSIVEKITN